VEALPIDIYTVGSTGIAFKYYYVSRGDILNGVFHYNCAGGVLGKPGVHYLHLSGAIKHDAHLIAITVVVGNAHISIAEGYTSMVTLERTFKMGCTLSLDTAPPEIYAP
jgi:hypothetical protein